MKAVKVNDYNSNGLLVELKLEGNNYINFAFSGDGDVSHYWLFADGELISVEKDVLKQIQNWEYDYNELEEVARNY